MVWITKNSSCCIIYKPMLFDNTVQYCVTLLVLQCRHLADIAWTLALWLWKQLPTRAGNSEEQNVLAPNGGSVKLAIPRSGSERQHYDNCRTVFLFTEHSKGNVFLSHIVSCQHLVVETLYALQYLFIDLPQKVVCFNFTTVLFVRFSLSSVCLYQREQCYSVL